MIKSLGRIAKLFSKFIYHTVWKSACDFTQTYWPTARCSKGYQQENICSIAPCVTYPIGHFRVATSLCFKARLSTKPLIWKRFFILMQMKLILATKVFALSLVFKVRLLETRKWPFSLSYLGSPLFNPSRSTHALHRGWLEIYPHLLQIPTASDK